MSRGPRPPVPVAAIFAVLRHPSLWWTAIVVVVRMAPDHWWRRPPFLPLPDASYLRFRVVTAYGGDGSATMTPDDLLAYLRWCRAWPEVTRRT